jgi:LysR family transcriptional regulator, hydrogen peroxide-inducible genes activator
MNSFEAHDFTMRQLQYAVAVADLSSFRRAADLCHVSQPSLSSQIAQLESVLGVRLFERDRRRVLVTTAGSDVVERAREILLKVGDLTVSARRFVDPLTGVLRIGVIPTVSPYLLPRIASRLRARFHKLSISWTEDKTESLLKSLDAGTLDAALLALEADVGDVEREVIAKDPFVLAAPREHKLAKRVAPAARKHLRNENILLLDDGHCFRKQALEFCSASGVREREFRATSLSTLVQMVAGGLGITLLPSICLATEVKRAKLRVCRLAHPVPYRTLALVWRKRSPSGAALRSVAGVIRDAYPVKGDR